MKYTPDEFVEKLDKKIISQQEAKRTLAIALRNRWRRTQLSEEISKQITPKNILMIGSTGVGKTAIIRALADIVDAPMIKVEATKYTQVGYVGESVNQMIEALAVEGFARYNEIKQSKYSKVDDYNNFLLVKKANILIREIEKIIREDLDKFHNDFYESDVVNIKLEKGDSFYEQEDIDEFNEDYLKHDYKLIDWVFDHKLFVEVLMLGLNHVPNRLFKNIKSKPKQEKIKRELSTALSDIFRENKLLAYYFDFILYPNRPNFLMAEKPENISQFLFKEILSILEKRLDVKFLPYYQSYVNYIHHYLGETPFIYERKEEPKVNDGDSDIEQSKVEKKIEEKTDDVKIAEELSDRAIVDQFKDHIAYTENMGIVFIDEIDKLAESSGSSSKDNIGKMGVQRDLLAILDGTTVDTSKGPIRTDNILFLAAGAFHVSDVSDLMPELLGRLPISVKLEDMNADLLENILINDTVSPIMQYVQLLSADHIIVEVEKSLFKNIAEVAHKINKNYRNMGARTLHLVVDKIFAKYATETATPNNKKTIKITKVDVDKVKKEFDQIHWKDTVKRYLEIKGKLIN